MGDFDGDDDGGGVDFFGDFEVVELAGGAEFAHADEGDVHQGDGLVLTTEVFPDFKISVPSALDDLRAILEGGLFDAGEEGGVTTMIGPVGVEHPDLGQAGVALLLIAEIGLAKRDIFGGHREAEVSAHSGGIEGGETGEDGNVCGGGRGLLLGKLRDGDLMGVDGVDHELLHAGDLACGK